MANYDVKYDINELERNLESLSDRERIHQILMKATSDAASFLQKEAKESLKNKIPTADVHNPKHENRWYNWSRPMTQGIKKDKMKAGEGYYVSILPDARNIWMENGTKERMTKGRKITGYAQTYRDGKYIDKRNEVVRGGQGHSTGRIPDGKYTFFKPAIEQNSESAMERLKGKVIQELKKDGVE